jgi:hypothetical protein
MGDPLGQARAHTHWWRAEAAHLRTTRQLTPEHSDGAIPTRSDDGPRNVSL